MPSDLVVLMPGATNRLHGEPSYCPTGCGRTVRQAHLMCGACWRRVPKPIQSEVWRTWRAWQRDMTDPAWDSYIAARAAALTSIGAVP